jgi:hypothetical protein
MRHGRAVGPVRRPEPPTALLRDRSGRCFSHLPAVAPPATSIAATPACATGASFRLATDAAAHVDSIRRTGSIHMLQISAQ